MSASILIPPKCVAVQIRHREPAGYRIHFGEWAGDSNSLATHTGSAFAIVYNLPAPQSVAVVAFGDVISAVSSLGSVLRLAIERTHTPSALASRIFVRGQRTICKFFRPPSAGSFLRVAFVNHCRESSNRIANTLEISPVVLSSSAFHANNKAWSKQHGAQRNSASGA